MYNVHVHEWAMHTVHVHVHCTLYIVHVHVCVFNPLPDHNMQQGGVGRSLSPHTGSSHKPQTGGVPGGKYNA